jgi:hypothetical protein
MRLAAESTGPVSFWWRARRFFRAIVIADGERPEAKTIPVDLGTSHRRHICFAAEGAGDTFVQWWRRCDSVPIATT